VGFTAETLRLAEEAQRYELCFDLCETSAYLGVSAVTPRAEV
jgi:hypothetical protein